VDELTLTRYECELGSAEMVHRAPPAPLRGLVSSCYGFREQTRAPMRRREGPGADVVLIVSFGDEWLIDDERYRSFAAGLHDTQVTTEHAGRSFGMQVNLAPPAAYMLLGLPMHELARRGVPLEEVLREESLVARLHEAHDWAARFELLDAVLTKRFADARPPDSGVSWAWRRLRETDGRVAVGALARELGWSRKRIVARFREQIGLPPKAVAKLLRFERARDLAERVERPDWARIAIDCGYYDQSHLIHDFRAVTGRTPVEYAGTFLQDTLAGSS
jgi:AraC-like DNA-binding protein